MITRSLFRYNFRKMSFGTDLSAADIRNGFVFRFKLGKYPTADAGTTLLEYPGQFRISTRYLQGEYKSVPVDDQLANYPSFTDDRGGRQLLEAKIRVSYADRPTWRHLCIGIPLPLLGTNWAKREIAVVYTGLRFQILIDGDIQDENLPVGELDPLAGKIDADTATLSGLEVATDTVHITRRKVAETLDTSFQYYMPHGYNSWAGDFVNFYHDGVFHVMYLHDRRHHGSRWGMGAHTFCHLTTTDLVNWTDHGPMQELTEPWQSFGTGTMCYNQGQYIFAFGWHTDRVVPVERTLIGTIQEKYKATGEMGVLDERDYPDLPPLGASYLYSRDGIHFKHSHRFIHDAWNPSVYTNPDGSINLYCGEGTWRAENIESPWKLLDPNFPRDGLREPMRNSCECPSFFSWNGHRYLLMGVTGFWTAKGDGPYENSAAEGYDIYDGLAVPMVAPYHDDRRLIGGWLKGIGWGSCLILRELTYHKDGRLGMKWPAELLPSRAHPIEGAETMTFKKGEVYTESFPSGASRYYELQIDPGKGIAHFAMRFIDKTHPGESCEFQLDFGAKRAQFAPCPSAPGLYWRTLMTVREAIEQVDQKDNLCWWLRASDDNGLHFNGHNFCIENVDVMDKPFLLRVNVKRIDKMCATVIDVEIAGERTILSNRPGMNIDEVVFTSDDKAATATVRRYEE